jgi:hypothetical protein
MQVQLSLVYLVSVQTKLSGKFWADGAAASYTWRTDGRWALLSAPEWLSANAILVNAATWGTLLIELAIAVLVWNRRWRFWVLAAGVVMHLTMMVTMNVAFFSVAMFVLYRVHPGDGAVPAGQAEAPTFERVTARAAHRSGRS